ncbi:MAG: tetratricopeptide repeat protein [Thermodesulfobacteriota bacterium]
MKKYFTDIIICLFIIAAALVIYAQIGSHDYIFYDDISSIYVPFVTNGLSLEKFGQAFYKLPDHLPYQVPIPAIVRLLLWEFFGNDLGKHHLFSLWLHVVNALLLYLILRSATGKKSESGFCAILFTVHPINVEAVSWLAGYNGILEAFFLMVTLAGYYHYVKGPSVKRYLLLFLPFMLGLMCKPTIAILPFLLLLLDYWPLGRIRLNPAGIKDTAWLFFRSRVLLEKLPLMALAPIQWAAGRLLITGQLRGDRPLSLTFHPGSIVDFVFHMRKIVYPAGLTICRPDPPEAPLWAATGLLIVLLLFSVLVLWKANTRRYILTGWLWFLIASAPVMLMVFLSGRPVEDHHLYIPLIGIFIMVSFGVPSLMSSLKHSRYLLPAAGITVLTALIPLAHLQTRHWQNSITIFNHALEICADNKKARANLGDAYMEKKEINKAIQHYRQYLRVSPDSALGHTKLANALASADLTEDAARHYEKALKLSPGYVPAHHGLADLLIRMGETDKAIALYRMALTINPGLFQTHNNLALALYEQGHFQEACDHLNQAIKINPDYQTAVKNLRIILDNQRQRREDTAPVMPDTGSEGANPERK